MKILGINPGHDASICVVGEGGQLEMAVAEERFNRQKAYTGWPWQALSKVPAGEYRVAIAGRRDGWDSMQLRYVRHMFDRKVPHSDLFNTRSWAISAGSRKRVSAIPLIQQALNSAEIGYRALEFFDHHKSHAASSYYTSGFRDALVITADGVGDGRSATAHRVKDGVWTQLAETKLPQSPGHMYGWATRMLGYKVSRHEGKLTGLAAYGNADRLSLLRGRLLTFDDASGSFESRYLEAVTRPSIRARLNSLVKRQPLYPAYEAFVSTFDEVRDLGYNDADVAALAQEELENSMLAWLNELCQNEAPTDVAVAGGVFANVRLNQSLAQHRGVSRLWVFPDMGDGGLSVGAALLDYASTKNHFEQLPRLESVALGPKFTDADIEDAVIATGLTHRKVDDIAAEGARLLANGRVIGWFQGRMEYGPRALGHRSILLHPGNREANDVVNRRLRRTEFMPFAPSVLSEYRTQLFDVNPATCESEKFMTVTLNVRSEWRAKIGAVVHVDGTARPQIVFKGDDPLYWSLIENFRRITGIPAVVNTSFNMHEEPIVCSPEDALRSFRSGAVDVLLIGNYVIESN